MQTEATHKDDAGAVLAALQHSQAIIEFALDGTILTANRNYLELTGYTLAEIGGRHHSLFMVPGEDMLPEYRAFWRMLGEGTFHSSEFRRVTKSGREVWIQASYNPVAGPDGRFYKVVKLATDVTALKLQTIEHAGKIEAIGMSQAVIEFALDGTILDANPKFCSAVGYEVEELRGRHHSLFVDPKERFSSEYREFWVALRRGEYQQAEYRRIGKNGQDVWIQATYNPIRDAFGRLLKIVKFATDTTQARLRALEDEGKLEAISRSQAVIEFDMDGVILTANANYLQSVGYELAEIVGRHHSFFVERADWDTPAYLAFWEALRRGEYQAGEFYRVGKGGRTVWIQASYNPIIDLEGKPVKVVKFATDITEEVNRREQIRMLSLVADATSNSVVITDANGRIEYVNAGFSRMTGYSFEEARGRKPGHLLQGPSTSEATRQKIREKLDSGQPFFDEIVNYTRNGEPYWITLFINPVADDRGKVNRFVSIQTDVTERKTSEARIAYLARHDPLTGLANRTLFQEKMAEVRAAGRPFALLCLDLDRFKHINDTFGHGGGDELLRQVADRLGECVRSTDTVVRLGGDEFAVIHEVSEAQACVEAMARRMIERIEVPFDFDGEHASISVSIGIALSEHSGADADIMLQHADRALYRAKSAGRGTYRVAEACGSRVRERPQAQRVQSAG